MTITAAARITHFGQGQQEPYARAILEGSGVLTLRSATKEHPAAPVEFRVSNWCAEASPMEFCLLQDLGGPVLDIGCGPGRMLSAARSLGLQALGIDTSAEAVGHAVRRGGHALALSVFAEVPRAGHWRSILLLDGNIGIGGNIEALLSRCRQLIAPSGILLAEVDPDEDLDMAYTAVLEDEQGNRSEPFEWARTGGTGLDSRADRCGWKVSTKQRIQGRVFYSLTPRVERHSTVSIRTPKTIGRPPQNHKR